MSNPSFIVIKMAATLELPLDLTIAALRKAGTGTTLLAALDALVVNTDTETEIVAEETQEPVEWVNAVNLEDEATELVEDTVEL